MTSVAEREVEVAATSRLLALGFSPPRRETLDEIVALARGLGARWAAPPELEEIVHAVEGAGPEELDAEFERLFAGDTPCPPYEASYDADPFRSAREMADVNGFYLAFGAEAAGPGAERPDHVACELEFLAFLALKRARGLAEDEDALCREVEDAFLRDHLGRFASAFFLRVREQARSACYESLARLGERFVAEELSRRSLEPEQLRPRRRLSVEADFLRCGGACAPQSTSA